MKIQTDQKFALKNIHILFCSISVSCLHYVIVMSLTYVSKHNKMSVEAFKCFDLLLKHSS